MDSVTKANKLAEEMSRFEQEILGAAESAPKGPSTGPPPISTPNTSTPQLPSQFLPRPPGPPRFSGPPRPPPGLPRHPGPPGPPPGVPERPGVPHHGGPRPLMPPRPPGPPGPRFQMPPGPPMGPPPNMMNGPPPRRPPPPPGGMPPQLRPPMSAMPPPRPHMPPSQPPPPPPPRPPMQQPPHTKHPMVPQHLPPPPAAPVVPPPALIPSYQQPPVAKPAILPPPAPPAIFPSSTTTSKSAASRGAEGDGGGAEGGVVEAGLLPVPKKPPKGFKTDVTKLRLGGGQVWQDHSLEDWDPNDFRIFVGDLGNDVNDDLLARTFSKYPSFLKAKVIRDKWTKKTKGYGFVSFKDPHDFIQAMREMNGRYIGNRPMKLRKSTWKDRQFLEVKKKEKTKKRLGFKV